MSTPAYRYSAEQRAEWIADILSVAGDRPVHLAYAQLLADYWKAAAPGDDSAEPLPHRESTAALSWEAEGALSGDFTAIHQAPLAPGTHGGGYTHDYISLHGKARRAALLAARERRRKREAGQAAGGLEGLLALEGEERDD